MTRALALRWLVLAALVVAGAWIISSRLSLSYDLAYFLPQPVTESQRVLIDRVGQGPGSRLLFVTLPGGTAAQRDRMAEALARLAGVRSVLPREITPGLDAIPAPVLAGRYLLTDVDTSTAGLRQALSERLRDFALMDDPGFLALVARDPHLASVRVLENLATGPMDGGYRLADGTPYLILDTRPPAFDLSAQQSLVAAVRARAATVAPEIPVGLYGAGAYGLDLQQAVRRESTLFSAAAAAALALLLWITYRSLRAVLLASLPLAAGGIAGLAALALLFPQVHGITLAFGFTLMGVTVDYGLHVLSHLRHEGRAGLRALWPTLSLSVASTALAFLAFTLSGSRGLVQLGVFSVVGILVAAFFAWFLLPWLSGAETRSAGPSPQSRPLRVVLRPWPWVACLVVGGVLVAGQNRVWNDNLSSLTPVPAEILAVDRKLRQQADAPDIRYLVVSRAGRSEALLERVTDLAEALARARADGLLTDFRAVTELVPAPSVQQRRRAELHADGLAERLAEATAGLPFKPAALQPFVTDVRRTVDGDVTLNAASYADTPLAELVDGLLYRQGDEWVALTFLIGITDPEPLATRLHALPGSALVDLRTASESLLATYRTRLLEILGGALVVVTLVLAVGLRSRTRLAWVMGTVVGSVVLTTGVVSLVIGSLSLFDLVATTLVAGLGLDYALFFSRQPADSREAGDTRHAVTVCFLSTATVFGLLGASGIPVLHGIGVTVATGVVVAYALAFTGRRWMRG